MRRQARLVYILIAISLLPLCTCDNRPIFDEMSENRLKVVLLGTYTSNRHRPWDDSVLRYVDPTTPTTLAINLLPAALEQVDDDSINDDVMTKDYSFPTRLMLDIAELRLGKAKFANYRQTYTAAVNDTDPFFNGDGIVLKNDDPPGDLINRVSIYFRKMLFDDAISYSETSYSETPEKVKIPDLSGPIYNDKTRTVVNSVFHEKLVSGYNFNQRILKSFFDYFKENFDYVLRTFPLVVPIPDGMRFDNNEPQSVLEIRVVLKNFIKRYEYDYYEQNESEVWQRRVLHYFAPSDWLYDVKPDEGEEYVGGNLVGVARMYVPGKVGTIAGTVSGGAGYVIAIPVDDDIEDYYLTGDLRSQKGKSTLSNPCNYPIAPQKIGSTFEASLDYYLKYEHWAYQWRNIYDEPTGGCKTDAQFETEWEYIEDKAKKFKIPMLATWSTGVAYTLDNVAPGRYKLYFVSAASMPYGKLPTEKPELAPAGPDLIERVQEQDRYVDVQANINRTVNF